MPLQQLLMVSLVDTFIVFKTTEEKDETESHKG